MILIVFQTCIIHCDIDSSNLNRTIFEVFEFVLFEFTPDDWTFW